MIPEIGHYSLLLALCIAIVQATLPLIGAQRGIPSWIAVAKPAARAQLLFVGLSFVLLTYAFITNDFSVKYVATNSNSQLPLQYRISAVWGAHEGSLLLWVFILNIWAGAVSFFSRSVPAQMTARVLSVMGMISIGFLLFTLITSNPFERIFPAPMDGRDLNPLLQDFGLVIHPPMLYMGYVGFSVAFAFAIAAMLGGRLDAAWARWSRPWTQVAWVFLTIGIALGSWWAYYELGWGGWWFWDPVENASFQPWLVGTALLHSLAVTEQRGIFKAWTVLLAIFAFSLSLLGTFLVRSGVLTSVHAFASDPERGVFILMFLLVVVGGSLALFAWRGPQIKSHGKFDLLSKETALLVNNILLVIAACAILLGTVYPLILDALDMGKISVGPPYFNFVFIPLTAPLAVLVAFGVLARWRQTDFMEIALRLKWVMVAALVAGVAWPLSLEGDLSAGAIFGGLLSAWVILSALFIVYDRARKKSDLIVGLKSIPRAFYGMTLAHIGIGVFIAGVTLTSLYSVEKDLRMAPGDVYETSGYQFRFVGTEPHDGPNFRADRGTIEVLQDDQVLMTMHPEKRIYTVTRMPMTEAAIDPGLFRDLYVALGEPVGNGDAWAVRIYHKPFIRWIWLGGIFMGIGGLLAASDRRYRLGAKTRKSVAAVPVKGAEARA
ncbi:MAG: heme lyase CcmF/NrfE family subunit [Gammaproteobacteria bacterium]|nr:heme lyase CcmF/NrfE family subunit [Gammaproteobacteria bacterium]MCP5135635.1 heme lyase CcmF/NrfE family subunit [Gammaproteobacteria bacterium]